MASGRLQIPERRNNKQMGYCIGPLRQILFMINVFTTKNLIEQRA